jgi:hypothetical protein
MANTIKYYQDLITDRYVQNAAAIGIVINPALWSSTNLDRLFIYAVAVCAWTIDSLMDLFKADVNEIIAKKKPHTAQYYAELAKSFQYGFSLIPDTVVFDNTGYTAEQIEASKIVKVAAAIELPSGAYIKVAKTNGTALTALSVNEVAALQQYMNRVKDFGVYPLVVQSSPADNLKLGITVVYDPLVLNNTGNRIDGTGTGVVAAAIRLYLQNLPFNGVLSLQKLTDEIQKVSGVSDLALTYAGARYGSLNYQGINISYTPNSGYLTIADNDLTITYVAQ